MGDFGELTESDIALYRAVLASQQQSVPELAVTLGTTSDEVDKSVARLSEFGLLRYGDTDLLVGVSPMLAEATVLGAEDLELGARRAALEQRRDTIRRLVPDWSTAFAPTAGENLVDVLTDPTAMSNLMMHYADRCERELLSVAPGRLPTSTRMDSRTRLANAYSARRGIKTRALYQHTALRDRGTRSYLTELAENGASIRFAATVPGRSLVVDRSVALLPIPGVTPGQNRLAVVRESSVITWIVATFEQLWAEASPLEDVIDRPHDETEIDQTRAAILRLMAEGEKDEAISRRLAISVRTCRRHIADYMAQVGASSRFQAGVIAARAGHTDVPNPF